MNGPTDVNAEQIAYWNAENGRKWADDQAQIDALFAPITRAAIEFAKVPPGARALDVGCGAGSTVLALAEAVGPGGHVTGVDVSAPMLEVAARRTAALGNVVLSRSDAATRGFAPGSFDLVFSRFGVMFFDDPAPAFTNIGRAMRPGARLAFVCWRTMSDNPFFLVPWLAAKPHAPPQPPPDPLSPGPFAFADPERVRAILIEAGFGDVALERRDMTVSAGALDASLDMAMRIGPVSRLLNEVDKAAASGIRTAIEAALTAHLRDGVVELGISLWFVSATVS